MTGPSVNDCRVDEAFEDFTHGDVKAGKYLCYWCFRSLDGIFNELPRLVNYHA